LDIISDSKAGITLSAWSCDYDFRLAKNHNHGVNDLTSKRISSLCKNRQSVHSRVAMVDDDGAKEGIEHTVMGIKIGGISDRIVWRSKHKW